MQHLEEGTIHAWLDGALSPADAAEVEQHVAHCAACAATVAEARGMIAGAARIVGALDVVPGGVIPKRHDVAPVRGSLWRSLRLTPFRAALAASLMVAAASLFAVRRDGTDAFVPPAVDRAAVSPASPAPSSVAVPKMATSTATNATERPAQSAAKSSEARGLEQTVKRVHAESVVPTADSTRARVTGVVLTAAADAAPPRAEPAPRSNALASEPGRVDQNAVLDSAAARAARSTATEQVRDALAERRTAGVARQAFAPAIEPRWSDFVGCYRVGPDSGAPAHTLPERFALAQTSPPMPSRSLVLPVDANGRPDSTIVGTWRPVNEKAVLVTFTGSSRREALFTLAPAGLTAESGAKATGAPVRVFRVDCRR